MTSMNISLPEGLKSFVDEQVTNRNFGTSSEYVRELIRKDQDRLKLRCLLLKGGESEPTKLANAAYFASLRFASVSVSINKSEIERRRSAPGCGSRYR